MNINCNSCLFIKYNTYCLPIEGRKASSATLGGMKGKKVDFPCGFSLNTRLNDSTLHGYSPCSCSFETCFCGDSIALFRTILCRTGPEIAF